MTEKFFLSVTQDILQKFREERADQDENSDNKTSPQATPDSVPKNDYGDTEDPEETGTEYSVDDLFYEKNYDSQEPLGTYKLCT